MHEPYAHGKACKAYNSGGYSQVCAAAQVAYLVGADPKEIIFTSGATESNNLAIKGVANFYKDKKKHIITTQTERMYLPSMNSC